MSNSYTSIYYHCVWSTKNRYPFLVPPFDNNAYNFIKNILHSEGARVVSIGGTPDHIHLLVAKKPTDSISRLMRCAKSGSSKLLRQHTNLKNFYWQRGFGGYSVSYSITKVVSKYIQNQENHHKTQSFEDEYRRLMELHQIEFDERYLFD